MPSALVSDVYSRARAILNDYGLDVFTDAVQLPYVKIANDELSDILVTNGVAQQKEISAAIAVTAGATTVNLPSNLLEPITLFERAAGSTETFLPMARRAWEPTESQGATLRYWVWREGEIKLLGATANREVQVNYIRLLTTITSGASIIEMGNALNYLSYKTAALCASHIGRNPVIANELEVKAGYYSNRIAKISARGRQSMAVRRKGFRIPKSSIMRRF